MPSGPLNIKEQSYMTDTPLSDMTTNTVKFYQPRLLLCQYKIHAVLRVAMSLHLQNICLMASVTATNTAAVQTCLMVEYCCNMDACWTLANQSACLPNFCHSILPLILLCGISLSAVPAGVVSNYTPCILVWCLTISRGASL